MVRLRSFFVGAFFEQTAGSSLSIPCPIFMKSLARMSSRVGRSAGLRTSIFLMRVIASWGTCMALGRAKEQSLMRW